MSDVRFKSEIAQLGTLSQLLAADSYLRLRLTLKPTSLTWRSFTLGITGLSALAIRSNGWTNADAFSLAVTVPQDYPAVPPQFIFQPPTIPFHPHIWVHGGICWGTASGARRGLMLMDWIRGILDYLQYGQGGDVSFNRHSPANHDALRWYEANRSRLNHHVPPIDMARVRALIEKARG